VGHGDLLPRPVYLWVVVQQPRVSYDEGLPPKVCDGEAGPFRVPPKCQEGLQFLSYGTVLIRGPIDVADRDGLGEWGRLQPIVSGLGI